MKHPFKQLVTEEPVVDSPSADQPLAVIREQFLWLDPDKRRILRRVLRQAQRLDAAFGRPDLFLPRIEICFYGVRSGGNTGHNLAAQSMRKLIRRWDAEDRRGLFRK